MSGDEENDEGAKSFADLVGETKPLRPGPARAPIDRNPPPAARRSAGAGDAASTFRWPDPDEPRRAGASGVSDAQLLALGRGEPAPEERIDLHGVRSRAASRLLGDRLESARARGLRCVVVIHGRGQHSGSGEAVLREALPGWLSTGGASKHVLGFAPAPDRLGGSGATLVLLRRD